MLTTTDPRDLLEEIRALADLLNDFIEDAQHPARAIEVGVFGANGAAELVRPLVKWSKPEEPQHPTETIWDCLYSIRELVENTSEIEHKGSELYDRLVRMADLLALQPTH